MKKKFEIKKTVKELKADKRLWVNIVLSTLTAIRSEESGVLVADAMEKALGSSGGGQLHANINMMVKAHSGNLMIMLGKFYEGGSFSKQDFMNALAYNFELLNSILVDVMEDEETQKRVVAEIMVEGLTGMFSSMFSKEDNKEDDKYDKILRDTLGDKKAEDAKAVRDKLKNKDLKASEMN